MIDTRFFFAVLTPEDYGHLKMWGPAFMHDAGFIEQQGEGWTPVDHSVTPYGDGQLLLSIMCNREIEAPAFDSIP